MLRGEQLSEYLDDDRRPVGVCALCKPRAESAGWVPAALAGAPAEPQTSRRRLGLTTGLRERFERAATAARPRRPEPATPDEAAPAAPEGSDPPEPPAPPQPPSPLEAFNASDEARKVAGLTKSLGEPRVTVRENLITVAWELSWYQWQVDGSRVTETAKGTEIAELSDADRAWNARAGADGALSLA